MTDKPDNKPCPCCGYCPACGRKDDPVPWWMRHPVFPPEPVYPTFPTYPDTPTGPWRENWWYVPTTTTDTTTLPTCTLT